MVTFEHVTSRPSALASLSGLSLADFATLYQGFAAHYAQDRLGSLTREGQPRRRAAGGRPEEVALGASSHGHLPGRSACPVARRQ